MIKLLSSAAASAASNRAKRRKACHCISHDKLFLLVVILLAVVANLNKALAEDLPDNDEVCRYLNAEKCNEIHESFARMAKKTRSRITGGNKPELRTFNTNSKSQEPFELKTLVVLVAWKGHEERMNWISRDEIDTLWNGLGIDNEITPTGSIKNFTERQAYGSVTFTADIIDWQVTDNTEAYYADKRSGMPKNGDREPHLRTAFHYVMNKMDEENFPWQDYDSDNDGMIDHVQFLHTGYGAEGGGADCYTGAREEDRIWSHALPEGQAKWTSKTGIELGGYSTSGVFRSRCGSRIARLGVMIHEFYHTLGLPDLYDREQPYAGKRGGLGGIGIFDMMACPFGANNNQMYPGSLSPWSKLELGFLEEPIEITQSGTYTARASNDYPDIYAIKRGYPEGEMLLLENRQKKGHDATLPTGGMLIFKIDGTKYYNGNKKHGFPGQVNAPEDGQSWPSNGLHYPIALLQADGDYDLEQAFNNGDSGDFYRTPTQRLGPGNGELVSTDAGTYPNTDSYVDGEIKVTGTVIDNFQETPAGSGIFTFRVTFEGDDPVDDTPTLNPTNPPTKPPTNKPTKPPTKPPTNKPTKAPIMPTANPTRAPVVPTLPPTGKPSSPPTKSPTASPTKPPTNAPTVSPTQSPTATPSRAPSMSPTTSSAPTTSMAPSNEPTMAPIDPSDCGHILQVNITTDAQPEQTTWEVTSVATGKYLVGYRSSEDLRPRRALESYTEYGWKICVSGAETAFLFSIFDTGGDGLQPPGGYHVSLDGELIFEGGPFLNETLSMEFYTKETQ
eukprot:CAMPEP_0116130280 /NCGR_PEP_ID=MMETSP0329-20121206/8379_1 /TAXON_ID=697910 /ORGANISM="Pseudo-nitzschia arenysensis, Strain B593" /LENGTH=785 /DNA_ID=CAMNT_0003624615 /DNA_START=130 /DNA_END=2487 /DNA_ORIENTATION=-